MSKIAFGRTHSSSLLGSLNDFSVMARMHFITHQTDPLERIASDLAETSLILPFAGAHPSLVTRRILDAGWVSSMWRNAVAPLEDFPGALGASWVRSLRSPLTRR